MIEIRIIQRNPEILLYAMPWAFPGWIDGFNATNPYRNASRLAHYIVKWIIGAKEMHDLTINYIGVWIFGLFIKSTRISYL